MTREQQSVVVFLGLIMLSWLLMDYTPLFAPSFREEIKGTSHGLSSPPEIAKEPLASQSKAVGEERSALQRPLSLAGNQIAKEARLNNHEQIYNKDFNNEPIFDRAQNRHKFPTFFMVNINTATWEELSTLPGIGPKTAQAIIEFRDRHGPFRSPEDLLQVRGLGPKKLAAIRERLTAP